jgi:hypothetical protein
VKIERVEYAELPLRAHELLEGAPLHDVWAVDLPGGGPGRTVLDLQTVAPMERLARGSRAVRFLFDLRGWLGRIFGWDRDAGSAAQSFVTRLTEADRRASLVPPGTMQGIQRVLFVSETEAISEIRNATVHGVVVVALLPRGDGYRAIWAIYVQPVGRITAWYMRLIDPFRRLLIYPTLLRRMRALWMEAYPAAK